MTTSDQQTTMAEENGYIPVASLEDFTGKIKVEVQDIELLIVNVKGEVFAVSDRCGHMGVSLFYGELDGFNIECPLHGTQFDVRSGQIFNLESKKPKLKFLKDDLDALLKGLGLPLVKIRPLKIYKVKIENGVIKVKLPKIEE